MALFPMFLKLAGRPVLVVGAGSVGENKIAGLLAAQAEVRVVALQATAKVQQWALTGSITWQPRNFVPEDLKDVFLVVAAASLTDVNELIFQQAQQRGILCNVVDVPELCDFYYPAVVRRGDLQIAISTAGHSPALAQRIRCELEKQFGPEYAGIVQKLGAFRKKLFTRKMEPERRKRLLHYVAGRSRLKRLVKKFSRDSV